MVAQVSLIISMRKLIQVIPEVGVKISSVLPFVVNFKYILEDMDEDVGYIRTFKEVLWCEIEERCRNNLNFHILKKARFFEVQFHIIPLKAKV